MTYLSEGISHTGLVTMLTLSKLRLDHEHADQNSTPRHFHVRCVNIAVKKLYTHTKGDAVK